jgi:hypothetical protein
MTNISKAAEPDFDAGNPDGLAPLYIKGRVFEPTDIGNTLMVTSKLQLELVYVEDMHPVMKGAPVGMPTELWTESFRHPGYYYRAGLWPSEGEAVDLDVLLDKVVATMRLMDDVLDAIKSGKWYFEEGRA